MSSYFLPGVNGVRMARRVGGFVEINFDINGLDFSTNTSNPVTNPIPAQFRPSGLVRYGAARYANQAILAKIGATGVIQIDNRSGLTINSASATIQFLAG